MTPLSEFEYVATVLPSLDSCVVRVDGYPVHS
jgi:hypothetical protein